MSNLSECSPACNCMYCKLSMAASDALRVIHPPKPAKHMPEVEITGAEPFGSLPDGTQFYIAQTYVYGDRTVYQRTMEDGDHNAVEVERPNVCISVPMFKLVLRK